jgi:hypothetical protein
MFLDLFLDVFLDTYARAQTGQGETLDVIFEKFLFLSSK